MSGNIRQPDATTSKGTVKVDSAESAVYTVTCPPQTFHFSVL